MPGIRGCFREMGQTGIHASPASEIFHSNLLIRRDTKGGVRDTALLSCLFGGTMNDISPGHPSLLGTLTSILSRQKVQQQPSSLLRDLASFIVIALLFILELKNK